MVNALFPGTRRILAQTRVVLRSPLEPFRLKCIPVASWDGGAGHEGWDLAVLFHRGLF